MLENRAASHTSAARIVRKTGREREKLPDEKMLGSGRSKHRWQDTTAMIPAGNHAPLLARRHRQNRQRTRRDIA